MLSILAVLIVCGSLYDLYRTHRPQTQYLRFPKVTENTQGEENLIEDDNDDETEEIDNHAHVQQSGIKTAEIVPPSSGTSILLTLLFILLMLNANPS